MPVASRRLAPAFALAFTFLGLPCLPVLAAIDLNPAVKPGSDPDGFHPAGTPAEQALDRLLALSDKDPDLGRFAVDNKERDQSKDGRLAPYFTPALRAAWAAAEAAAVRRNCGGRQVTGEACGIDIHPITCAQDSSPNGYVYRTEATTDGDRVMLSYRWPRTTEVLATYRLIRTANRWVLDGVSCANYLKFNME